MQILNQVKNAWNRVRNLIKKEENKEKKTN